MRYTEVAGHEISNMSLGTVQLGMDYGIANENGKPDREKSFSMLRSALENGITSLDTAHSYGDSEQVIGSFFESGGYKGKLPFLTTKFLTTLPVGSSDWEVEKEIIESIETSLLRLKVKKVNCVLIHHPEDMTKHGSIVANTLKGLISRNYTDIVGTSVYHPQEVETMLQNELYQAVQIPMSLFDQRLIHQGYLKRLEDRGICVFVRSVFLQGLFFMDPDNMKDSDLDKYAAPHLRILIKLARHSGMSIAQFAISFIRDLPGVTSLVLGADTPVQVNENILLFDGPAMSEDILHEVFMAFSDVNLESIMKVLSRPKPQ